MQYYLTVSTEADLRVVTVQPCEDGAESASEYTEADREANGDSPSSGATATRRAASTTAKGSTAEYRM